MSVNTDALAAACLALTEGIRATATDPADAIRILIAFVSAPIQKQIQPDEAETQIMTINLMRRSGLASAAMACADWTPATTVDAAAMIQLVGGLLDTEIIAAADAGEMDSYMALRDLRYAVIADLEARSAALPDLVTVRIPGNLPSLVMAYRLYGQTTREPGMVARANVTHPGYMPGAFEALSA